MGKSNNNNKIFKPSYTVIFCTLTIFLVFIFFYRTIFYSVKIFDEITPFKETYLPVTFSLSEMFELISFLGLNQYFEATNTLYSNIVSLRSNPLGNFLQLFIQFLCKKNPVSYHLYSLIFHLINTGLVFFIISKVSFLSSKNKDASCLFPVSILTLLWAIHPVNIEPVLLLTNGNVIFSYTICLVIILIYLSSIPKDFKPFKLSFLKSLILFLLFVLALFIVEYHFILPFILLSYTTAMSLYNNPKSTPFLRSFLMCLRSSLITVLPLLAGVLVFFFFFLFSDTRININSQLSFQAICERVFWLSPQILFHYIKLFFLPINLSIDQTFLVKIAKSLFDPYAIFCCIFIALILLFSFLSLMNFVTFFPFFISLIPFSHMLAPVYNLCSERYLYFPSFILIFGFAHFIFFTGSQNSNRGMPSKIPILVFLVALLSISTIRAYLRTLDWKDSFSLYYSAINTTDNPLYKAFRYKGLLPQEKIFAKYPEKEVETKYIKLAIKNLKQAIVILKEERRKYQKSTPQIIKLYGLDPTSLLVKAGYILAQTDFTLNNDIKRTLKIINPYVRELPLLDSPGLSFYASLLFHHNMLDKAEEVLRIGYKKNPYSLRIIFPLCDLIQIKYGNLQEIENYSLRAFKYFPYDTFTLLVLTKIYKIKPDLERYAYFSYIYGLRHHSIEDLENARNAYLLLNKKEKAEHVNRRIAQLSFKYGTNN